MFRRLIIGGIKFIFEIDIYDTNGLVLKDIHDDIELQDVMWRFVVHEQLSRRKAIR